MKGVLKKPIPVRLNVDQKRRLRMAARIIRGQRGGKVGMGTLLREGGLEKAERIIAEAKSPQLSLPKSA